jgi:PGF-CTERM protein
VAVEDHTPPVFLGDLSDETSETGKIFQIVARFFDNIELSDVRVIYRVADGDTYNWSMGLLEQGPDHSDYQFDIDIPFDTVGAIEYHFYFKDGSGNWLETSPASRQILDVVVPTILLDGTPSSAVKGSDVLFSIDVRDNIGIDVVVLEYWYGEEEHATTQIPYSSGYSYSLGVPRHPDGDLSYFFLVSDAAGNTNQTSEKTITLLNEPPSISPLPIWQFDEGDDASLDLAAYLADGNDRVEDLTLTTSHANITVLSLILHLRLDVWQGEFVVEITVSDGEDDTSAELMVIVMDTNDPPQVPVIMSPVNGTEVKRGEAVVFEVMVDDPDLVEHQDLEVTWRSNINGLLNRYQHNQTVRFSYDELEPGEHTITVTVSDGEHERQATVVVIVKKPKKESNGSPGFGPSIAIIALCAMTVLLIRRRR